MHRDVQRQRRAVAPCGEGARGGEENALLEPQNARKRLSFLQDCANLRGMKLDARDIAILKVLSGNGRITNAELAEKVGLSASPCWERVRRLEKAGIIDQYHARISLRKLGPHVRVFVSVELTDHTAAAFQLFEQAIQTHEEIVACWALGGGFDYLMQVVTRDIDAYQTLIDALLEARIGVARYFTYVVTKRVKDTPVPPLGELLD